jgi:hemoglobin
MNTLTASQINRLVHNFYARVEHDAILGPIFNDVAQVDWEEHLPKLCAFWNSVMLGTNEYRGNAMLKHLELNRQFKLTPEHFEHWLNLFKQEAIAALSADDAKLIVARASLIADSIKNRLNSSNIPVF